MKHVPQSQEQIKRELSLFKKQCAALDTPISNGITPQQKEDLRQYFNEGIEKREALLNQRKTMAHHFSRAGALARTIRETRTNAMATSINVVEPVIL